MDVHTPASPIPKSAGHLTMGVPCNFRQRQRFVTRASRPCLLCNDWNVREYSFSRLRMIAVSTAAVSVHDLAAFCQMYLNGGVYAHHRIVERATIQEFIQPQPVSQNTRTIGWVVPTEGSSSGHYFSAHSFGHTGFTGTSIWMDPDRQIFVVLLTNRVNPTRENMKIAQVRPAFHDAVMKALGYGTEVIHP